MREYVNIPADLKELKQWVAFKFVPRDNGKAGKIPINPNTGGNAKSNDPTTWGTYGEAVNAVERYGLAGIGFEFANGYFGIDLDGVINDAGELRADAKDVVDTMQSYTEYSPSGTGLHILCKGSIPEGRRKNDAIGFEIYETGRFFTVTGKKYPGTPAEAVERTQEAAKVHSKYFYTETPKEAVERPVGAVPAPQSDTEILDKMFNSSNGSSIRALYEGDLSQNNNDHSAADIALVRHLAYWTNGDAVQIDRLFRASGLMRDKWDSKRGADTYGNITIVTVLANFTPYTVQTPIKRLYSNGKLLDDFTKPREEAKPVESNNNGMTIGYFLKNKFKDERKAFASQKIRKTGFTNIDQKSGGLYSGLYVIGAPSSLGKTTLMLQIADQLADQGENVLFFSLEQSTFELASKSIARESFRLCQVTDWEGYNSSQDTRKAMSAIQIRNGTPFTQEAKDAYKKCCNNTVRVIEGNFTYTVDDIKAQIEAYIAETGNKPIVIIDYLQIIQPVAKLEGANDKAQIDYTIHALKTLQRSNDLVLFVISSFNRANYMTPVGFESFKESGGIEYTCDVLWGLQYSVISTESETFDNPNTKIKQKREAIKKAKREIPRKIQLVCLKNRYGKDYDAFLEYNPVYDYFQVDKLAERKEESKEVTK